MFSSAIRLIFGFSNKMAIIFSNSSSAPRCLASVADLDEVQVCWAGLAMSALVQCAIPEPFRTFSAPETA
jgi:hypothetical protein